MLETFDLVVIGSGKAGKTLAMSQARSGKKVALIERGRIGGTCINVGCIPTKALVGSARTLRAALNAKSLGIQISSAYVNLDELRAHKATVVSDLSEANHKSFIASGMDFILGEARFIGIRTLEVATEAGIRNLIGTNVVINTGLSPSIPPIPGLRESKPLTSESLLQLDRLPKSLLILGGGYIGCEFAQLLSILGVKVTVIEAGDQLMSREDKDISEEVLSLFVAENIDVRLGVRVDSVKRDKDGSVVVRTPDGVEIKAEDILVALGRSPAHATLNPSIAGVELTERGFVKVNEFLKTSAPGTWAAGDIAGTPQFTHASWDDYRILKHNIEASVTPEMTLRSAQSRLIPYTVFLTPELGRVGITETQALKLGLNIKVAKLGVSSIPRARTMRELRGAYKAVIDADTGKILGAACFGPEGGEVITTIQMAMLGGLTYDQVRDAIISHPTMAEGLNLLFEKIEP